MSHKYDDTRRDLKDFAEENKHKSNERVIEDWIALNSSTPSYLMPTRATLRRWLNGRKEKRRN